MNNMISEPAGSTGLVGACERAGRWFLVPWLVALVHLPAAAGSIEFVSPRHLGTALGQTVVEVRVQAADGVAVERVELMVDGVPLATLTGPPWKTTWDAGDATSGHRLEARAHFSDGTINWTSITTMALRINQVEEVDLVNLYVLVRDMNGQYVTDLELEDFRLTENGEPQKLERFSTEHKPLRIAIVLDTSLSMRRNGRLVKAKKAALNFLGALKPSDEGMVVTFNDNVQIAQALTEDRSLMARAIEAAEPEGGTALYDSVFRTSSKLQEIRGRRVMVLLSDGKDEAQSGLEPGSLHTIDEALDQALRSEVMIFAIGIGGQLEDLDFYGRETHGEILTRMAKVTGGRVVFLSGSGQLKKAFQAVADDLRHQYSLAYSSDDDRRDGTWREIRLTVPGRNVKVITRKGYYAPLGSSGPRAAR